VRPDAPWCTQCYSPAGARTTPAAAAPPAGTTVAGAGGETVAPAGPEVDASRAPALGVLSAAVWPCAACGERNALADERCASCGEEFLGALRHAEALLVLPVVGDLAAMPPARRLGVAVAVVVALLVLAVLLGLLLA
jgi:hypothetical protein